MSQTDSPPILCTKHGEEFSLFGCHSCFIDYCQCHPDFLAMKEREEKLKANKAYPYSYALTINAGSKDGSKDTTDCDHIVTIFNRVCATKQLKNCRVSYAYEAYTKVDKNAPRTEDNLKRTFPHIHALIESYKPIHKGTLEKTTKCITKIDRQKFGTAKWQNYLKKDNKHQPTIDLFRSALADEEHFGVIYT